MVAGNGVLKIGEDSYPFYLILGRHTVNFTNWLQVKFHAFFFKLTNAKYCTNFPNCNSTHCRIELISSKVFQGTSVKLVPINGVIRIVICSLDHDTSNK